LWLVLLWAGGRSNLSERKFLDFDFLCKDLILTIENKIVYVLIASRDEVMAMKLVWLACSRTVICQMLSIL
jgi:hypothetical protein